MDEEDGQDKKEENSEENENKDGSKAKVSSSTTDYLYSYLKNKGIIKDDKVVIAANKQDKAIEDINKKDQIQKTQEPQTKKPQVPQIAQTNDLSRIIRALDADIDKRGDEPFDELEKNGVGIFWNGQLFVAPKGLMAMNPEKDQIKRK